MSFTITHSKQLYNPFHTWLRVRLFFFCNNQYWIILSNGVNHNACFFSSCSEMRSVTSWITLKLKLLTRNSYTVRTSNPIQSNNNREKRKQCTEAHFLHHFLLFSYWQKQYTLHLHLSIVKREWLFHLIRPTLSKVHWDYSSCTTSLCPMHKQQLSIYSC